MSIEENRNRYEGSTLQVLMEHAGHTICERCYCCDSASEEAPCWQCGGFEPDYDDEWDDGWCSVCNGEGRIYWNDCIGRCDENGHHKAKVNQNG